MMYYKELNCVRGEGVGGTKFLPHKKFANDIRELALKG